MNGSQLFNLTRWRLTAWYVGVMGVILSLGGFVFYQMICQSRWQALHQELRSVAGTLHDGLEPALKHPGHLEASVTRLLPGICRVNTNCTSPTKNAERHILGVVEQRGYYVRLLDLSGRLIATVGMLPDNVPFQKGDETWQTLEDDQKNRYHQISLRLKSSNQDPWGYLQIGQSLRDHDDTLANLSLMLLLGIPVTMLFVSGAGWWLAGLAMQPVYLSYRKIQQFTTDVAHELRTPLAATRATVEAVTGVDKISESEARSTFQIIARQNQRLSQLVQDLLLLSRIDFQSQSLKQQPCRIQTLLYDIFDEFEALATAAGVYLTFNIPKSPELYVLGDEEQLYRLVANLVANAIHYTPKSGDISVKLEQDDRHIFIKVLDSGIGIAPEHQSRIFDRFYRVNSDRARTTGGSGLGLAIAQAIAQAHHGTIQVQSQLGQESLFTVRLPQYHESSKNVRLN
jgi:signal transduction histidine kinase